tara:strand:+ start:2555 stop:2920 length:366 start_codon:yes stop_codon:yes gene_type:complete
MKNIFGEPLKSCCSDPVTGYFRDGFCRTDKTDHGSHTICAEMTESFLTFSKLMGNDLTTPRPEYSFPGLKPGDKWCLCALRWKEAYDAGQAPLVILESTDERALKYVHINDLISHAKKTNV